MNGLGFILRAGLVAAITATALNLVVYALGRGAGVEFTLLMSGSTTQIGAAAVLLMSIVSIALGTALAALLARRGVHRLRWAQVAGAAVAVLSALGPLSSTGATSTGILLIVMHLVTGASYVLALEVARRRSAQTEPAVTAAAAGR